MSIAATTPHSAADHQEAAAPPRGRYDYALLALVGVLVLVGLEVVFSTTYALSLSASGSGADYLLSQSLSALIGAVVMFATARIDYRLWRKLTPVLVVGAIVVLLLILVPGLGQASYGATRWLKLGPLPAIQPSEFGKLAVIFGTATWFSGGRNRVHDLEKGLLPWGAFVGGVTALIMKEPDMGTTLVVVATAITMFFLAGASLKYMAILLTGAVGSAMVLINSAGYRSERLQSFIDPWQDPTGLGFHIIQLLIAMGSGGLFGLGPGASRQKFFYIPSAQTDGIFAILGEELGFVGCVVVICLFAALIYRGVRIAGRAPDQFGSLLAMGIVSWFAFQTLINLGGITHTIPLTGIPLPFISYGGSALVATLAAVGVLLNISRAEPIAADAEEE